jgi:hypothetical protein
MLQLALDRPVNVFDLNQADQDSVYAIATSIDRIKVDYHKATILKMGLCRQIKSLLAEEISYFKQEKITEIVKQQ